MPPLTGCSIAIAGTFTISQAQLQSKISDLGGTVSRSVTKDTTCLVATPDAVSNRQNKVEVALKHAIPIVSMSWLLSCETTATKEDFSPHDIVPNIANSNGAAQTPVPSQGALGKRTAESPSAESPSVPAHTDDKQPSPRKKQKTAKSKQEDNVGDTSVSKTSEIVVPLDEGCPLPAYQVLIDDDGAIFDASLNQSNASANNNKFYRIQLVHDPSRETFKTWTRWGRVGEHGQSALIGNGSFEDALKQYNKKFKDKSGLCWADRNSDPKSGKYAYVERNYGPDSDDDNDEAADGGASDDVSGEIQSKLGPAVQSLMQLIFNQQYINATMSHLNYDANKMPLGKLSGATINRGFRYLKELASLLQTGGFGDQINELSNQYYSTIPHDFGRNRPPVILTSDILKKELELLESLGDLKEAARLMKNDLKDTQRIHPLDRQFRNLNLGEITPLDPHGVEFEELSSYLWNTRGVTHSANYHIENIFRIERIGEADRFAQSEFSKINSDRRLLWHGSRATNFGGILSQGLRIAPPEAPVSGYMFGKGIYLADMSSKSANYCNAYISGGQALLLLCEAELGDPLQKLIHASYNAGEDAAANGSWSTWGMGRTGPSKWKDASCVHPSLSGVKMPDVNVLPGDTNIDGAGLMYNEYIAYNIAQVRLRYLFRVRM